MFFDNSYISWTSIKVLLWQWDLPLKITISLIVVNERKVWSKAFMEKH